MNGWDMRAIGRWDTFENDQISWKSILELLNGFRSNNPKQIGIDLPLKGPSKLQSGGSFCPCHLWIKTPILKLTRERTSIKHRVL
jgi:hypothetical protein